MRAKAAGSIAGLVCMSLCRSDVLSESKPEDRATFNLVHDKLFKSRPHVSGTHRPTGSRSRARRAYRRMHP